MVSTESNTGRDLDPAAWLTLRGFGVVLALLLIAAFPDVFVGAGSFFHRDFGVLAYPTVAFHREAFWRGEMPLWNPLSHCGVPFLAQWGTMSLYPGALIYLLLPLPWSLNVFCLVHLWLGGMGMFWLAQRWTGSGLGAAIAGVAFTFNGLSQSCLLWPNYTVALGWMPWVVGLVAGASVRGGRPMLIATLGAGAQLLSGAPEIIGMTWLVAAGMALLEPLPRRATEPQTAGSSPGRIGTAGPLARLLRALGVLAAALALTAVQLLPFLDLLAQSQRSTGVAPTRWALPGWGWVNFLAPLFRCEPTAQGTWFQPGQQFFGSVYLGAGVIALAGLGALRQRTSRTWALVAIAALGLGLAWGPGWLSAEGLGGFVPAFLVPRYPVKFVLLLAFCIPLLAALGVAAVAGATARARVTKPPLVPAAPPAVKLARATGTARGLAAAGLTITLALGGVLMWMAGSEAASAQRAATTGNTLARLALLGAFLPACYFALTEPRRGRAGLATLAALAVLALDYRCHLPNLAPTLDADLLRPGRATPVDFPAPGAGRVFIPGTAETTLLLSRVPDLAQDFTGKRLALWSNLNLLEGVAKVNGAATLRLAWQAELEAALLATTNILDLPLLDFLGVTHHTSPGNVTEWVRRPHALPLVTAGQRSVVVEPSASLARVLATDFTPREVVILASDTGPIPPLAAAAGAVVGPLDFRAGRVRFELTSPTPTVAVIAQTYHPNWQAAVDGSPAPLWRANHAFQAVPVPAGRHQVELRYEDTAIRSGLGVSLLALAAGGLGWMRSAVVNRGGTA